MKNRGAGIIEIRSDVPPPERADDGVWQADLDARYCRTAKAFLISAGVTLGFPAYYGCNWDAFYECFGDLLEVTTGGMGYEFYDRPGRPEHTLHLVVRHAEELLADGTTHDLDLLIWKLRDPYPRYPEPQLWHRYAALRTTFVCAPETQSAFAMRLHDAGRDDPYA
jgi:Barstar (barnase inhibitor)